MPYLMVILDVGLAVLVIATVTFSNMLTMIRNPFSPAIFVKPSGNVLRGFSGVPSGVAVLMEFGSTK